MKIEFAYLSSIQTFMCLLTKHGPLLNIHFVEMKIKKDDNMIKQNHISMYIIVSKSSKAEKIY